MQDNLKDHIQANSKDFEIYPFDAQKGWNEIADAFEVKKKKTYWPLGIAASLAVVFITSVLVVSNSGTQEISEVQEIEGYYEEAINHKITLVKNQIGDDQILNDLEAMDAAFAELKADLNENVDNGEVIEAMMENYRLKLKILEEILVELEKEEK